MHPVSGAFSEPKNVSIFSANRRGEDYGAEKCTSFGAQKMSQNLGPFFGDRVPSPGVSVWQISFFSRINMSYGYIILKISKLANRILRNV